jgi:simple sugar transport system ATP-binding protein
MRTLFGMVQADEGIVFVEGKPVTIRSPHDAMALGIGMIHQHFTLVPVHTVTENLMLGMEGAYEPRRIAGEVRALGKRYGLEVDPDATVRSLPVGMQQRVEILKALIRRARVLIMDEPTAVLTPQEAERLFDFIREFRAEGHSVILISHKLNEVMAIADRISVLRDGRVVGSLPVGEATERSLARLMVGRDLELVSGKPAEHLGETVLSVKNLSVRGDRGNRIISDLSFEIRGGEILGVAGVSGNGQEELAEVLCGLRSAEKGQVGLCGTSILNRNVSAVLAEGVGYIPADRHTEGLVLDMSVEENLILKESSDSRFASRGFLKLPEIGENGKREIRDFSIKTPSGGTRVKALSGGNQQKVVIAREIRLGAKLLVAVQPTRGLDLGAADYVHQVLLRERDQGKAILLVSTELPEVLTLSDRIGVIYRGSLLKIFPRGKADVEEIGLLMAGAGGSHEQA